MKKFLRPLGITLGFAVAGVFIYLSVRALDWEQVGEAFRQANPWLALAGIPVILLAYAIRLERWRLMLRAMGSRASRRELMVPFFGGFALNNVLPLRLGDVARAAAFSRQIGVSPSGGTASLLVERVFDLYTLLLLGALSLLALPELIGSWAAAASLSAAGGLIVVLTGLTLVLFLPRFFAALGMRILATPIGKIVPKKLASFAIRTLIRISHIVRRAGTFPVILMSVAAWVLEGAVILCALASLNISVPAASAWLGLVAGNLGTLLPGTPGHFGTFHYLCANVLTLGGGDFSRNLLATTIAHFVIWSTVSVVGLTALLSAQKRLKFLTGQPATAGSVSSLPLHTEN